MLGIYNVHQIPITSRDPYFHTKRIGILDANIHFELHINIGVDRNWTINVRVLISVIINEDITVNTEHEKKSNECR